MKPTAVMKPSSSSSNKVGKGQNNKQEKRSLLKILKFLLITSNYQNIQNEEIVKETDKLIFTILNQFPKEDQNDILIKITQKRKYKRRLTYENICSEVLEGFGVDGEEDFKNVMEDSSGFGVDGEEDFKNVMEDSSDEKVTINNEKFLNLNSESTEGDYDLIDNVFNVENNLINNSYSLGDKIEMNAPKISTQEEKSETSDFDDNFITKTLQEIIETYS